MWCSNPVNECPFRLLPLMDTQDITTIFPKCCLGVLLLLGALSMSQSEYIFTVKHQLRHSQELANDPPCSCQRLLTVPSILFSQLLLLGKNCD